MGGKRATVSNEAPRINSFQVQKSSYGVPVPVLLGGTNRVSPNLLWYGGFKAVAQVTKTQSGGKGGGGVKQTTTEYAYYASLIMLLAEGPIESVPKVIRDKSEFTDGVRTALAQAGLSFKSGTPGQSVWPYLTTNFPSQALGYSELAYVYAADYPLTSGANLQNHTFEIVSPLRVAGKKDANPADLVEALLTSPQFGVPLWTADLLGDLEDFGTYSLAANLLLSPLLDSQRQASSVLEQICDAANSAPFWSEGKLKIKPYGTEATTANGVTWEPDLTPAYDLTARDFIVDDDEDDVPVRSKLKRSSDAFNFVQIEFLNRNRQYNVETMPAFDQAAIEQFGERKEPPVGMHLICDPDVARQAAELRKNRVCYIREEFEFELGWVFDRLEQMDYVTLTEPKMGLDRKLVRIIDIVESEDLASSIYTAEEVLVGVADAPLYPSQGPDGYIGNYDAPPGNVSAPIMFTPPSTLTGGALQLWAAVSGLSADWGGCEMWVSLEDDTYQRVGTVWGGARYGVSTTALPSNTSPDTTNILGVDLGVSGGEMDPATLAEAQAAATIFYLDGELMAYRDATLTAPNEYDLGYLFRGLNGSPISSHASGTNFIRLDDAVFRYPFLPEQVGRTVSVKFRSFNVFGRALQDLEDLSPYNVVLQTPTAYPDPVTGLVRLNIATAPDLQLGWNLSPRATRYKIYVYSLDGATFYRTVTISSTTWTYTAAMRTEDGSPTAVMVVVVASSDAGDAPGTSYLQSSAGGGGGGPQPAAVTGQYAESVDYNLFGVGCSASSDPAVTGYALYASKTNGFTPAGAPTNMSDYPYLDIWASQGTWYGRIAAYNADWNGDPSTLNFAPQVNAYVLDYRENCVAPETPVLMHDGAFKPAGELVAGDLVMTRHETTREWMRACVMQAYPAKGRRMKATFNSGAELTATINHRLGLVDGTFAEMRDLTVGAELDGIDPVTVVALEDAEDGPVVRLSVGDARTCITAGVLSHNIKMGIPGGI